MKRKSPGINKILRDQGSKFSSLFESKIKNLGKNTGSAMKKYTSLRPCFYFSVCPRATRDAKPFSSVFILCKYICATFKSVNVVDMSLLAGSVTINHVGIKTTFSFFVAICTHYKLVRRLTVSRLLMSTLSNKQAIGICSLTPT